MGTSYAVQQASPVLGVDLIRQKISPGSFPTPKLTWHARIREKHNAAAIFIKSGYALVDHRFDEKVADCIRQDDLAVALSALLVLDLGFGDQGLDIGLLALGQLQNFRHLVDDPHSFRARHGARWRRERGEKRDGAKDLLHDEPTRPRPYRAKE